MIRTTTLATLLVLGAGSAFAGTAPDTLTADHLTVVDLNNDGQIDITEYRVMASNVFILLDTDNDDVLTPAEASAIPVALFEAMDTNKDGKVDRMEYGVQILADFQAADLDGNGLLN